MKTKENLVMNVSPRVLNQVRRVEEHRAVAQAELDCLPWYRRVRSRYVFAAI